LTAVTQPTVRTAGPARAAGWTVEIRRDDEALAEVRAEWNDLFARCPEATPFQAHAWLDAWWRSYGVPGRLRLVLVRLDGKLVAAAALIRRRRWSCRVATPLGGALSDFTDVLVDGVEGGQALADALLHDGDWDVVDFPEARPDAAVTRLPGQRRSLTASLCFELPATPMDTLVKNLPAHARKTVRRRVNQIAKLGLDVRPAAVGETDRAVADLLRLHAAQWQGRGVNRAHLRPEFAAHLTAAVRDMTAAGHAQLLEYRLDGDLVASNLVVVGPALAGGYLYGARPDLRERLDVTTLLVGSTVPLAHDLGCATMSMLRGAETHKLRWRPVEVRNRRVLLAPSTKDPRVSAYVAGVRAWHFAIELVKEKAPWVRALRDRVIRLRDRR
jgi:CelD/BcsL family acetyltransferase involved in cellulose biosynthesis